jgi:hypothetical protein
MLSSASLSWIWGLSLIAAQDSLASMALTVNSSWIAASIMSVMWIGIDIAFIWTISQPFFEGRATSGEYLFLLLATLTMLYQSGQIWSLLEKISAIDQPLIIVLISIAFMSFLRIGLLILISRLWTTIDSYLPD